MLEYALSVAEAGIVRYRLIRIQKIFWKIALAT